MLHARSARPAHSRLLHILCSHCKCLSPAHPCVARCAPNTHLQRTDARLTRRELRQRCGMSDAAIRVHLERLVMMEYVQPASGRNGLRFEYELLFDGNVESNTPQMIGLIDVEALKATTATSQGATPDLAPRLHVTRTHLVGTLQGEQSAENTGNPSALVAEDVADQQKPRPRSAALKDRSRTTNARTSAPSLSSSLLVAAADAGG